MSQSTAVQKPTTITSQPEQDFNAQSMIENSDMDKLKKRIFKGVNDMFQRCEDEANDIVDENYSFELLTKDYIAFKKRIYGILDKNYKSYTDVKKIVASALGQEDSLNPNIPRCADIVEGYIQDFESKFHFAFDAFEDEHGITNIYPDEWEDEETKSVPKAKTSSKETDSLKDDYLELKGKFLLFDYQEESLKEKLSEKYKITFPVDADEEDIIEDYTGALNREIALALREFEKARGLEVTPEDFDRAEAKKQATMGSNQPEPPQALEGVNP